MVGDLYIPDPQWEDIDMLPGKWCVSWNDWTKIQCSTSSNHLVRVYGVGFGILNMFRLYWISVAHTLQESWPLYSLLRLTWFSFLSSSMIKFTMLALSERSNSDSRMKKSESRVFLKMLCVSILTIENLSFFFFLERESFTMILTLENPRISLENSLISEQKRVTYMRAVSEILLWISEAVD